MTLNIVVVEIVRPREHFGSQGIMRLDIARFETREDAEAFLRVVASDGRELEITRSE